MTRIVCAILRVTEFVEESIDAEPGEDEGQSQIPLSGNELSAAQLMQIREMVRRLWQEICELLPRQRIAYVLNPTDADIEVFIVSGIVTQSEMRAALGLSENQYQMLWSGLKLKDEDRSMLPELEDDDERFALLRKYLPVQDKLIARLLSATRSQVIGLRSKALERLKRRMIAFGRGVELRGVKKKLEAR
jgi:hypothetical protein